MENKETQRVDTAKITVETAEKGESYGIPDVWRVRADAEINYEGLGGLTFLTA